jgi:epoxide hydrolase 4
VHPIKTDQYVELSSGVSLHYASCGDPKHPPLLLLHGFPEFWYAWAGVMPGLADHYHVIAPDLRGFNLSDKPTDLKAYAPRAITLDLLALIDQLCGGKVDLVAHDWGGAHAWNLAINAPEKLHSLAILNAPHPYKFWQGLRSDPIQQRASSYMNWLRMPGSEILLAEDDFARMDGFFLKMSSAPWFDAATREIYHRAWGQPGALLGGVNYYRGSPLHPPTATEPGPASFELDPLKFKVSLRTKIIWGLNDVALPPSLIEGLDQFVSSLDLETWADANHWLIHQFPTRVVQSLLKFYGKA